MNLKKATKIVLKTLGNKQDPDVEELIETITRKYDVRYFDGTTYAVGEEFAKDLRLILTTALEQQAMEDVEKGRLSVLKDFDNMCKADAFVGFTEEEWKAVRKFFAFNKEISGWDTPLSHKKQGLEDNGKEI